MLWYNIPMRRGHTKINKCVKRALYNWIIQYPQFVQSPIANCCLKLSIDDQAEPQLVPKLLLKVSVIELHNSMMSTIEEEGTNEAR